MSQSKKRISFEETTAKVDQWIKIENATSDDEPAVIEIDGVIGYDWWEDDTSNTAKAIKAKIKAITALKAKTILVRINSPGGLISDGLAIHDALASTKAEVITDIQGIAASMATVIGQVGNTRRMSDNALYLIHQPMTVTIGNINTHEQGLDDLKAYNKRLVNIYTKRSGKSEEEIVELMNQNDGYGVWIDGDKALEMGLIDEVYEPMKAAAIALDDKTKALFHLPDLPNAKNLNNDIMSEDKKTVREMFVDFKNDLIDEFKKLTGNKDATEKDLPEEVTSKITAFEDRIKAIEDKAPEDNKQEEVDTLTASIAEKDTEIENLKTTKAELETKLTQAKAQSTKPKGPAGKEDPNEPENQELKELNADVRKLKAAEYEVHVDDMAVEDDPKK